MEELAIGTLYSNEEIYKTLTVSNAGGIRLRTQDNAVLRAVIMTSTQSFQATDENPYHDRLEGDILTYTAAGKVGEQTLAGMNNRLTEQRGATFPIHGFSLVASRRDKSVGPRRWRYLGLLEYLRHYPDTQLDSDGKVRKVWLFEFKVHPEPNVIPISLDAVISSQVIAASRTVEGDHPGDEIVDVDNQDQAERAQIEQVRSKLLLMDPRKFEYFVKDLLVHSGFAEVCVTKYSADGGVDVNARVGAGIWMFESTVVQVQPKRWLHSVGRKEVAELRGSLQPFAKGAVMTTSHFSKAAINEAKEEGKIPITLIDGYRLSKVVLDERFQLGE
jgi:HJR/Mrr/RecB family endonuclease